MVTRILSGSRSVASCGADAGTVALSRKSIVPQVFPIVPASTKPLWWLAVIIAVLSLVLILLVWTAYSARHSRIEIGGEQLTLVGDLWGRSIPLRALRLEDASIVDLSQSTEYRPRLRTLGTGLPGYASGWFRLRNGEKALAYLTRRDSVLYLPTTLGYVLLLSCERPEELLESLRSG